ncbi:aquaporin [Hymenobacter yonginensis]|uniref:Aquaporin n=1 Tax=Hymenobacter yonginensis TaxID=748197 RepID=A0ABY7PU34_9BACT|nr:aquaporin [Hymenobacter yonginensis]WBO86431.1 aquaporin [Hymenobacter yonginensis]
MQRYVSEVLGTFAIVFCGTGAIIINQETHGAITHVGVAMTFGLIVSAMIYALGNVSGAHFNPAVTVAFTIAGRFAGRQVLPYIVSQLTGAVLASAVLRYLFPANALLGATLPTGAEGQSFVLEFILTYFLMLVILNVACGSKEQGLFAGLAIGAVVLLEAMFAGPICGASMNPARSVAPALVSGHLEHLWLYLVAPTVGAIAAVFTWQFLTRPAVPVEECE